MCIIYFFCFRYRVFFLCWRYYNKKKINENKVIENKIEEVWKEVLEELIIYNIMKLVSKRIWNLRVNVSLYYGEFFGYYWFVIFFIVFG